MKPRSAAASGRDGEFEAKPGSSPSALPDCPAAALGQCCERVVPAMSRRSLLDVKCRLQSHDGPILRMKSAGAGRIGPGAGAGAAVAGVLARVDDLRDRVSSSFGIGGTARKQLSQDRRRPSGSTITVPDRLGRQSSDPSSRLARRHPGRRWSPRPRSPRSARWSAPARARRG